MTVSIYYNDGADEQLSSVTRYEIKDNYLSLLVEEGFEVKYIFMLNNVYNIKIEP